MHAGARETPRASFRLAPQFSQQGHVTTRRSTANKEGRLGVRGHLHDLA